MESWPFLGAIMTISIVPTQSPQVVVTEDDNTVVLQVPATPLVQIAAGGLQPPAANNHGVLYLKNNTVPTPIAVTNGRAVASGTTETGSLYNFTKDAATNSLKYAGETAKFLISATFNFYSSSQDTCGFYIGINRNIATALDPNADRISESEIYSNAGTPSNQPQSACVQTVAQLNYNDRVFFIVQNKSAAHSITIEFMKLIAWQ